MIPERIVILATRQGWYWRATLCAALLLAVGAVGWGVYAWHGSPKPAPPAAPAFSPDPRLVYHGPFRNIDPGVGYVGDEACDECHHNVFQSYHAHPMGRSLAPIAQLASQQVYDAVHHNPFAALGSQFQVRREGDRVWHRQSLVDDRGRQLDAMDMQVDYAVGSGTHGYSYLTLRGDSLFQTPIAWFSQRAVWDLSPGFVPEWSGGRPIAAKCLYCHANRVRPLKGLLNRYETPLALEPIGCERCHGPGERHVAARRNSELTTGPTDYTIVNPSRLDWPLREAVCEQCHLEGDASVVRRGRSFDDFRPGLPLEEFRSVFVYAGAPSADHKAVNHVVQMHQSQCFRQTSGANKLGCISCHDPHVFVKPEQRAAYYRPRCLECHATHGCTVPEATRRKQSEDDNCIQCHMPPYSGRDIPHAAWTDHRIPRRPGLTDRPHSALPPANEPPLVSFHRGRVDPQDRQSTRDLALALGSVRETGLFTAKDAARWSLDVLQDVVRADPGDLDAQEVRAKDLAVLGRRTEALFACEALVDKAPGRESAVARTAALAEEVGDAKLALVYWRRAVRLSPERAVYRGRVALLLEKLQDWDELGPASLEWVRRAPGGVETRLLRVRCLFHAGDRAGAATEFAKVRALHPSNLDQLEKLYDPLLH